jgi:hypothetical protein
LDANLNETVSGVENSRIFLRRWPVQGWVGLALVAIFWPLNWLAPGQRTFWAFFPLWLGYILTIDGLVVVRKGTSLFLRSRRKFAGLFLVSVVYWWVFEALNVRAHNWQYIGVDGIGPLGYLVISSINFSIVIPAVFEAAELASTFRFIRTARPGLVIRGNRPTTLAFFLTGWVMIALLLAWPTYFYPFLWLSLFFIQEPVNVWLGNRTLASSTSKGDWRPVYSLWIGVLMTGFFWEMWNFFAWPKWTYSVPGVGFLHIFEMPLLGYGGYMPFALELFAFYHLVAGLLREKLTDYVEIEPGGGQDEQSR